MKHCLSFHFGMVVFAAQVGFSPAFGAFIMGSVLSETIESEHIEKLVSPVKDLFGAIFFVSVGMMVDPNMIVEYRFPIIAIVVAIVVGQTIFGTLGVLLSGQPLKIAMQCGFSLTQIGEFAFIIASLGVSLHVPSDFLYPIVVAVSVITTFLTPYMIRLAVPAYNMIDRHIPERWLRLISKYASGTQTVNHENNWKKLLMAITRIVLIYSVLSIAIIVICLHFIIPLCIAMLGDLGGRILGTFVTILALAPFLRAMIMKKNRSIEFKALWADSRFNHAPLISTFILRVVIGIGFVMFVIESQFTTSTALLLGIAILLVAGMIASRFLKRQSIFMERTFVQNLRFKEMHQEYLGEKEPEYAGRLLARDLHLSDFVIPAESSVAGKTLQELNWRKRFGVHVAAIIRGRRRVNIPDGNSRILPNDKRQVIGTDDQLAVFSDKVSKVANTYDDSDFEKHEMQLKQFVLGKSAKLVGTTIGQSTIRTQYHCLVVGVELHADGMLHSPDVNRKFEAGDVVWVVGEELNLERLFAAQQKE